MALATPKEQALTDLAVFFSTDRFWVETVTYTPKDGAATSIPAIVTRAYAQEPYVRGADFAQGTIKVKAGDVENPQYGDTFAIVNPNGASETWALLEVIESNARTHQILIERYPEIEEEEAAATGERVWYSDDERTWEDDEREFSDA